MYGLTHLVQSPSCSVVGQVLFTNKASILIHWSRHFQSLFGADWVIQDPVVLHIPQWSFKEEMDELPSVKEITKAIKQLKSGRAAGVDGIPPELWKEGGPALHSNLHKLLVYCWEQGKLPSDLCNAVIVTLYKNKGKSHIAPTIRGSLCSPLQEKSLLMCS